MWATFLIHMSFGIASQLGQRDLFLLILVLAPTILVVACLVALEEQHLANALIRIDTCRQWRGIGYFQRHIAAPARLEWRRVKDNATARIRRFPDADA